MAPEDSNVLVMRDFLFPPQVLSLEVDDEEGCDAAGAYVTSFLHSFFSFVFVFECVFFSLDDCIC